MRKDEMERDIVGNTYGRWTVLARCTIPHRSERWVCRCVCGTEKSVPYCYLRDGQSKSCGCFRREVSGARLIRHGGSRTTLYHLWNQMVARCDKNHPGYGERGISVCNRWRLFENFRDDMGPRPNGTSIDRINNDGNYEPGNCRWATPSQQGRNKRSNVMITYKGETRCLTEWSEVLGMPMLMIYLRIKRRGWSVEDALTKPARITKRVHCRSRDDTGARSE